MIFWQGIVEDRDDPHQIGRHRVRVIGKHNPDKNQLPTENLPWALCLLSCSSNSNTGVNGFIPSIPPGTRVLLYYEDDCEAQVPIIIGILANIHNKPDQEEESSTQNGFVPELEEIKTTPQEVESVVVLPGESSLVINRLKEAFPRKKYHNRTSSSVIATDSPNIENDKINRKRNTPDKGGNLTKGVRMAFFNCDPYEVAPERKTNSSKGEFHNFGEKLKAFDSQSTFDKFPPVVKNKKDSNNNCVYTPEFKDYGQEQFINDIINNFDEFLNNLITSKEELWAQNPGLRTYKDI